LRTPRAGSRSSRPTRLPPLNLFRAFDAAARNLSFTKAADELMVTQSAVSQQIRQLEEFLDVRLFRRLPRRLELTREGVPLAGAVHEAISLMRRACGRLADPAAPALLCVNATPSFATRWLAPRLHRFMEINPNIKVTLLASNDPVDFHRQDIDVAIRWGNGEWPGVRANRLAAETIVAVASPELVDRTAPIATIADLRHYVLLQIIDQPLWTDWVDFHGYPTCKYKDALYFNDSSLMIEAAIQGQGICLTSPLLVEAELRNGRLVALFGRGMDVEDGFHLLCSEEMFEKPKISAFRDWIFDEVSLGEAAGDGPADETR
jgi:LysR family glycine cleavage system transcriptional activator